MTPVPLDLPLRPSEATELANLIFEHAERKPLTDELRSRLASRAGALNLQSVTPYFGSLERDPVHPSAYYLAVDGPGSTQMLYLAPASAPTSSIYRKPLLIGRVRRANGPEMVISAIPFGPGDREHVETFAARINGAFYPQPQGARTTIAVADDPAGAFTLFRTIQKRTGKNVAALAGDSHAALWAAIRAGWRTGYTVATPVSGEIPEASYSRYSVEMPPTEEGLKIASGACHEIRRARAASRVSRAFDFEVDFEPAASPEFLVSAVEQFRDAGCAPQLIGGIAAGDLDVAAVAVRRYQITLAFRYGGESAAAVQAIAKATGGRLDYRVKTLAEAEFVAENLFS